MKWHGRKTISNTLKERKKEKKKIQSNREESQLHTKEKCHICVLRSLFHLFQTEINSNSVIIFVLAFCNNNGLGHMPSWHLAYLLSIMIIMICVFFFFRNIVMRHVKYATSGNHRLMNRLKSEIGQLPNWRDNDIYRTIWKLWILAMLTML